MKLIKEVKHFSHSDLDGIGCIVMAKHLFTHTAYEVCDYDNVDDKVTNFIMKYVDEDGTVKEVCPYELILITDISVKDETAIMLDQFSKLTGVQIILIDHHKTSMYLTEYDWAEVNYEINGVKTSGTSEMMRLLVRTHPTLSAIEIKNLGIADFAEQVRLYDTWDWTRVGVDKPRLMHELLMIIGRDEFIKRFTEDLDVDFSKEEQYLLDMEVKRIERFVRKKAKQMIETELHGYKVGVVYAEEHHSVLGNELCKMFPEIDFVIIMNLGAAKVSFRATKEGIDVGAFAKEFYDGGGHAPAAGCEFKEQKRLNVFKLIMDNEDFLAKLKFMV